MARPAKRTSSAPPARGAPGKQPGAAKRSAPAKAAPKKASAQTAKSPGEIAAAHAAHMRQAAVVADGRAAARSGRAKAPAPTKAAPGLKRAPSQTKSQVPAKQAAAAMDLETRMGRLERANARLRATAKEQAEMLADLGRQLAELRAERASRAARGQASARREGVEAGTARAGEDASSEPAISEPEVSEGAGSAGTREGFYIEEDEAGRGGRTSIENLQEDTGGGDFDEQLS